MDDTKNEINADKILPCKIDVVIVGAGFAGLYMLHRSRESGFSVKIIEAADGVGGVWYWNRYPGARCDIEAMQYSYSFSEELQQEWKWSELFPAQPEILRYLNYVTDKFDLRKDIQFDTRVNAAIFDENDCLWKIQTSCDYQISARFCIMATGCLSVPEIPYINGVETFKGNHYHTSRWRNTNVNFNGRCVAIFGTGSTGVQAIPIIAEEAKHLYVFQRTANFTLPIRNKSVDEQYEKWWKSNYAEHRKQMLETITGCLPAGTRDCSALSVSPEERLQEYEKQWQKGNFNFVAAFNDLMLNEEANETAAEFLRGKIREIVKNPIVAEKLIPRGFPFGAKRFRLDSNYYETFNRNNVTLINLQQDPIDEITSTGIRAGNNIYNVDDIVFATGFDAITGAILNIDIVGRDSEHLKDKWINGPCTYLGLMTNRYPNFFMITGPGSTTVFGNAATAIEHHVDWITDCLIHLRKNGYKTIEPDVEAENAWGKYIIAAANFTLFAKADSWVNGTNIESKPKVFMAYVGGMNNYRKKCQDIVAHNYRGFILK